MARRDYGITRQLPHISVATANSSPPTRATTPAKTCRRSCILSTTIFAHKQYLDNLHAVGSGYRQAFYYFNRSHNATFNNVYRVGKSGEFGINAAYLNDRDTRQSHSATTNYLPDGGVNTVDEMMNGTARMQKAYGDLTYMNNGDESYLKEQLKFDWSTTDADSRIVAGATT